MPNRYCIASGVFTDPAIWSDTDGGLGGASAPALTDDIYLNNSVAITGWPGSLMSNRNLFVGNNAVVDIEFVDSTFFNISSTKRFVINGKLTVKPPLVGGWVRGQGAAAINIGSAGLFDLSGNNLDLVRSPLTNKGRFYGSIRIYADADPDYSQVIGRAENVYTFSAEPSGVETFHSIRLAERFDVDHFAISLRNTETAPSLVIEFDEMAARIGTLNFRWQHSFPGKGVTINQAGSLELYGDIVRSGSFPSTPTTVDWQLGERASLAFVGSNDQSINMPPDVIGQTWFVDKPAGQLDLTSFNGCLLGRLRQLIVRAASTIDLSGPPPVLPTTTGAWHCYYGLKADSVSPEGPTTIAEHLQEAMDSCENYGLITIPGGKTLCTKSFKNHTGARVSGTGTLCIRYGGLTDSGIIDPTVNVRYFDRPVLAVLSAPNDVFANTLFSVDLAGSVGDWFRLDWDDESFSETQTPGILTHGYIDTGNVVLRALRLTVGTDEGKTDTVTKTITVYPIPQPEVPIISRPVEIDPKKLVHGTPRGNLPAHYRYTLALGRRFMHDTLQLFCPMSESGRALANGSGLYLGRITHSDGRPPDPGEIASASYTVYRLDAFDAAARTPMEGHTDVPLDVAEILLPELVVDENWPFDEIGYNFRHTPDDTTFSPFPVAGREYLVVYILRPLDQAPKIIFQYRVHVV